MKLNPKVTGGLAWAGLVVILAVPSADMLTSAQGGSANRIAPEIEPETAVPATVAETKPVAPVPATRSVPAPATQPVAVETVAAAEPAASDDPVEKYLASGKKLPSYISDAPAEVAVSKPATTTRVIVPAVPAQPAGEEPAVEVAAVGNTTQASPATQVAPVPYPASLRPKAPAVVATTDEEPLVIDEDLTARRDAAVAAVLDEDSSTRPVPPANIITSDELEEWDSGSLADYLERRGMLNEDAEQANSDFDEDGFFLDEGPNRSNARVVRRLPRRDPDFFIF